MNDETESPFASREQRRRSRDLKKDAVLRAAVGLFNARGFHATSLDDVAASLGVTKPVIYHYFGNKEQVLFHCLKAGLAQLSEAAEESRGAAGNGLERLTAFLRRYGEINMTGFGRCVILTGDHELSSTSRAEFRALKRAIDRAMRALIAEGMADGSIASADVRLTAFTLAGALGWVARWYDSAGASPPSALAKQMVDVLTAGLAPRDAGLHRSLSDMAKGSR